MHMPLVRSHSGVTFRGRASLHANGFRIVQQTSAYASGTDRPAETREVIVNFGKAFLARNREYEKGVCTFSQIPVSLNRKFQRRGCILGSTPAPDYQCIVQPPTMAYHWADQMDTGAHA